MSKVMSVGAYKSISKTTLWLVRALNTLIICLKRGQTWRVKNLTQIRFLCQSIFWQLSLFTHMHIHTEVKLQETVVPILYLGTDIVHKVTKKNKSLLWLFFTQVSRTAGGLLLNAIRRMWEKPQDHKQQQKSSAIMDSLYVNRACNVKTKD